MCMTLLIVLALMVPVHGTCTKDVTTGTELQSVFLIHRHGDRTPVKVNMELNYNQKEVEFFIQKYGSGQLTDAGKRRAYKIGKFIESRYGMFLSPKYNLSEIYLYSTDSTRTKMTALASMAAVYPPTRDNWSKIINWTPVPYTTEAVLYDTNLFYYNCPTYINYLVQIGMQASNLPTAYSGLLAQVSKIVGKPINILTLYSLFDAYYSELNLGLPLNPKIAKLWPQIEKAVQESLLYIGGNENMISMEAGVLLNDFFNSASAIIAGNTKQRVKIYSAHDMNVYALMAASQIMNIEAPGYGSIFALELRKVASTGKYVVLPVFVKAAGMPPSYLQIKGCDSLLCDFNEFYNITSKYILNATECRTKCGWSEDLVFDTSSID